MFKKVTIMLTAPVRQRAESDVLEFRMSKGLQEALMFPGELVRSGMAMLKAAPPRQEKYRRYFGGEKYGEAVQKAATNAARCRELADLMALYFTTFAFTAATAFLFTTKF